MNLAANTMGDKFVDSIWPDGHMFSSSGSQHCNRTFILGSGGDESEQLVDEEEIE